MSGIISIQEHLDEIERLREYEEALPEARRLLDVMTTAYGEALRDNERLRGLLREACACHNRHCICVACEELRATVQPSPQTGSADRE